MKPANKLYNITLLALLFSVIFICTAKSESEFNIGGYYKNFSVVYDLPDIPIYSINLGDRTIGSVSNRLRIDMSYRPNDWLKGELSYNFVPRIQDPLLFLGDPFNFGINPMQYRFDDFDNRLYPDNIEDTRSFGIYHNLDRASLSIRAPFADIYIGRQAIAWGSSRVINATDVIAPYAFTELDTEHRIGVDAVRVRVPIGLMNEIDAGIIFGEDFKFENNAFFIKGRAYIAQTDITPMIVGFRENLMLGVDIARSIGRAGFWFEAAHVWIDALTDDNNGTGDDYFRLTTGLDYSLADGLYGFAEYHFNQAGTNEKEDYFELFGNTAYREGSVYLLGKHYLIPGISWQISALVTGTAEIIFNAGDQSFTLTPYIEYNIAANIYLSGGAYLAVGESPETTIFSDIIPIEILSPKSEFGTYPDMIFASFRFYF